VTIEAVIDQLADWRRIIAANRPIVAAFGMAWWKRREIRRFLWVPGRRLPIVRRAGQAIRIAAQRSGSIAIWPSRAAADRNSRADGNGLAEAASQSFSGRSLSEWRTALSARSGWAAIWCRPHRLSLITAAFTSILQVPAISNTFFRANSLPRHC